MSDRLSIMARVSLDAYLLANAAAVTPPQDGRLWERNVGRLLQRPEFKILQSAGRTTLFELRAASGARHEIDAAGRGRTELVALEAKANGLGATKSELSHFHVKTFDYYCAFLDQERLAWWRAVVTPTPVKRSARAMCVHLGIYLCDPAVLPLPVLLRAASRIGADMYLPEPLLREAIRLFEPIVKSLDEIWPYDSASKRVSFRVDRKSADRIDDVLYVQQELSEALLDLYDRHTPMRLPNRTAALLGRMEMAA
jgi:hypothetical protein